LHRSLPWVSDVVDVLSTPGEVVDTATCDVVGDANDVGTVVPVASVLGGTATVVTPCGAVVEPPAITDVVDCCKVVVGIAPTCAISRTLWSPSDDSTFSRPA
jgi:hypothetical protein